MHATKRCQIVLALLMILSSLAAVCLPAGAAPALQAAPRSVVQPQALRSIVEYLASDSLEGRGAGTQGIEAAARFIATRFEAAGLEPAGDDKGWFQDFEVTIGVRPAGRNALRLAGRDVPFESDWMAYGFSDTGTVRAPLVFAGYGITASEYDYDDYAGLDAKGKVVVVLRYEPGQNDSASAFAGKALTPHSDIRRKAILAREHGAAGMLVVTGPLSTDPDELAKLRPDVGYYSTGILCGQVRRAALLAAQPGFDLQRSQQQIDSTGRPASASLGDAALEWTVGLAKERTRLRNVVGLLPGRDPHRAVVLGAHYDHLGMGGPESLAPDLHAVHHGADDNASGTAALIEIARSLAARGDKPAQSLLFVAFSGEELGLAGSSHYVKSPVYPMSSTTAMLNMDMVGRLRDRKLIVFGTSTASEFPALLDTLNAHGPKFDLRLKGDGYGPSDQMSFFKMNVPVLHFFTGPHSEYHKPSDVAASLDYDGLAEVATFVARVADALTAQPLTFVAATGPVPSSEGTGGGGFRTYLGTVPDYGQDESIQGVLLSGVRAGSPAEKAGMRGGDVIVQIGETVIRNIQDFVYVLRTRRPDETVEITVLRAGARQTLKATLAKRP